MFALLYVSNCQSTDFQVQQNLGNIQRICISCTCFTTWDAIMAGCYFAYAFFCLSMYQLLCPVHWVFIQRATVVVCCYLLLVLIIDGAWKNVKLTETLFCHCTTEWSLHVNSCECMHVVALHSACISCPCGRSDLYLVGWSLSCRREKQLG